MGAFYMVIMQPSGLNQKKKNTQNPGNITKANKHHNRTSMKMLIHCDVIKLSLLIWIHMVDIHSCSGYFTGHRSYQNNVIASRYFERCCLNKIMIEVIVIITMAGDFTAGIMRTNTFNSLRSRQNGRLFADDTFKRIFWNEKFRISTKNSLKFAPKGLINNIPALVLIMAWRRPGDKPLSEPMLVRSRTHICIYGVKHGRKKLWSYDILQCDSMLSSQPCVTRLWKNTLLW